jgi:hypothetical protein
MEKEYGNQEIRKGLREESRTDNSQQKAKRGIPDSLSITFMSVLSFFLSS